MIEGAGPGPQMVGVFCFSVGMASTLSELLQRANHGENRKPLRRPRPLRAEIAKAAAKKRWAK